VGQVLLSNCSNLIEALKIFAHSQLFADKQNHINEIENFWNQAKRHMRKLMGFPSLISLYF
jgi:transposase-like protein